MPDSGGTGSGGAGSGGTRSGGAGSGGTGSGGTGLDSDPRWEALLESLEAELQAAAAPTASATGTEPAPLAARWIEPQNLGPLPASLAARAGHILRNQQRALVALDQAKTDTAKHLAALQAIPSIRSSQQSVYLDVEG